MKKRMLYLEDLWNFFASQNKDVQFSSKDSDSTIVVHVDEPFTFSAEQDDELNLYAPMRLCHTLKNINQSSIPEKAMKDAMHTAYEMPILGYIYPDPDNEEQYTFAGHEMYTDENDEIVYEESPIGVVTSEHPLKLVYEEDVDKTYLEGVGKIWRTYTKAAEILEREKKCWVSVELIVDDLSYSAKDKVLVINAFRFSGVTILGKDRDSGKEIHPGMAGADITIADFSEKNNSIFSQNEKVIEMLSALSEKIDNLNINPETLKEGGKTDQMFEELLKKYRKTIEEIDFEYEGLSDEELEALFAEHFAETPKKRKKGEDDDVTPSGEDDGDDSEDDDDDDDEDEDDDQEDDDDDESDDDQPDQNQQEESQQEEPEEPAENPEEVNYYSVTISKGDMSKTFSVSLQDKIEALYTLVNDTYAEQDGCYYDCEVFDDDKYVIMSSWWTGDAYKQAYKVKKESYSLVGDRIRVKAVWCTEDEEKALENMRANYSSIESELASFKAEPEKQAVLAEECYAQIADTDAYKELLKQETHFSMSVDEVRAELDKQLLEYAKGHKVEFSAKEEPKKEIGMKLFGSPSKKAGTKTGRYGGLFSK